ncbi:MAG: chromosomal replication initiator protein DnaA [Rhabdochlamydiaceae bacterium]|nr:chromosomal replication initiator protein DnaA [Candidatus Amphrikana amoebophyrae]
MMQAWDDFIASLEKDLGSPTILKWVKPIKLLKFDAGNVYLEAKDSFQAMWFEEHILPKAKKGLINNNGRPIKVHLAIFDQYKSKNAKREEPKQSMEETINFLPDRLEPSCTFEQFIPGNENLVPYQILCKLTGFNPDGYKLETPSLKSATYNPIFIHGKSGTGKTHLLMSAASTLQARGVNAFYVKAETFTQHVVFAIRMGKMQEFRQAYRHVDVLLIDGAQILARKNATQEELFHTFNTLHTASKQIIISANMAPRFLENIEDRLISRFEWGLSLPLEKVHAMNELENILRKRTELYRFPLKQDVIEYLMKQFPNAKSLSGAIETLNFKSQLDNKSTHAMLELGEVKSYLYKLIEEEAREKLTHEKILTMVAENFGVKIEDITGKSQSRDSVLPRQIAMYLLRKELSMPFVKIGHVFSRDHSTVMSSIKNITKSLESKNKEVASHLTDIQRKIVNF